MLKKKRRPSATNPHPDSGAAPEREIPLWANQILDALMQVKDEDPARRIFVRRAIEEIIRISRSLSIEAIEETAVIGPGTLLLLRTLQAPELLPELEKYEPLASPYLKGLQAQKDLLQAAGGLMTGAEVAEMMGVSRQAVDKWRTSRKLIAIPHGQRGFCYPACQFQRSGPLPGLDEFLLALGNADGWSQLTFLLSANSQLQDRTPLDALKDGRISEVLEAAAIFGEHGAL